MMYKPIITLDAETFVPIIITVNLYDNDFITDQELIGTLFAIVKGSVIRGKLHELSKFL